MRDDEKFLEDLDREVGLNMMRELGDYITHDGGCPNFVEVRLRAQLFPCQKCLLIRS
jgi:hypothetical protein